VLIEQHGAVSETVALAMADGARRRADADLALAITGIAGPEGGSESKPVGTVWIGLATASQVTARRFLLAGDRAMIRDRAAKMALTLLRFQLLGQPMPF
jgi:PncC family amidohydrolase